jgi:hypothetical protein
MKRFRAVSLVALGVLVIGLASVALGMKEQPRPLEPPDYAVGRLPVSGPFVILQQGDTSWVQVHTDTTYCPGDILGGHGGEATGGPDGSETWCFEGATYVDLPEDQHGELVTASDSCGTNPPWNTLCFSHVDVRTFPSQTGINFWHLDTFRCAEVGYTGDYCLWCGSDSLWIDGQVVECGTWAPGRYPGYGDLWNCHVRLDKVGFTTVKGCTLAFDPRYDTECKYDYFYVDYMDTGGVWRQIAMFNASSNNPGDRCGDPSSENPDYWGNTDTGQPNSARWQQRTVIGEPAFWVVLNADSVPDDPAFRWRFVSDGAWSDKDGRGDTDGACQIDNVTVYGDGQLYYEDFEHNSYATLAARGWTFPPPDPVAQCWHQEHDPDPPYEGTVGPRTTCTLDSSIVWRGRPKQGYMKGTPWRSGWFYRLRTPPVAIPPGAEGTGCVVQYDNFMCCLDYTCDYTDTKVRFYDSAYGKWCPWVNIDGFILYGGCFFWNFDREENVTPFYGPNADSMMFAWDLMDVSSPDDFCRNKHKSTDNMVDNVSIGFFDGNATIFRARVIDILQDSFHDSVCCYNSFFDAYDKDTLYHYNVLYGPSGGIIPKAQQLYVEISDKEEINEVRLYGSVDKGGTWVYNNMIQAQPFDPQNPDLGGEYYGTFCPDDFYGAGSIWPKGIELWYYVWVQDRAPALANIEYWPADANPSSPGHTDTREDYFTMSIMPMFPADYDTLKTTVLLVDGYGRNNYDYAECMEADNNTMPLEDIYENTLIDAGYCYDKYDISGAGSNIHVHPLQYTDYDVVVWFTGPYFSNYLFDKEAQVAIRAYLAGGGNVVLCGDRIAYNMFEVGEDSLGGEFGSGIMGCNYLAEMESPFDKGYLYLEAAPVCSVFNSEIPIAMDSLLVYRECPYLKDQSYVKAVQRGYEPAGYRAQPLLYVLNPQAEYDPSDGAIYVEYLGVGQCVYVNYDLCALATHERTECPGGVPDPPGISQAYNAGAYFGRVDLMKVIINDIFGLSPTFPDGGGGTSDVKPETRFVWALGQNFPNPAAASTEIRFEVARTSAVSIKVYNAMGQLVRTLEDKRFQPGRYSTHWDGTNSDGRRVSSGVYFYKMDAGKFAATKKMLLVK